MFVVDATQNHMITCLEKNAAPQSLTCYYLSACGAARDLGELGVCA